MLSSCRQSIPQDPIRQHSSQGRSYGCVSVQPPTHLTHVPTPHYSIDTSQDTHCWISKSQSHSATRGNPHSSTFRAGQTCPLTLTNTVIGLEWKYMAPQNLHFANVREPLPSLVFVDHSKSLLSNFKPPLIEIDVITRVVFCPLLDRPLVWVSVYISALHARSCIQRVAIRPTKTRHGEATPSHRLRVLRRSTYERASWNQDMPCWGGFSQSYSNHTVLGIRLYQDPSTFGYDDSLR